MAASSALSRCVVSPAGKHTASVIFLHGSGVSSQSVRGVDKENTEKKHTDTGFLH
ncbi:hypothetical protein FKM82_010201 [Ascaphus truei]